MGVIVTRAWTRDWSSPLRRPLRTAGGDVTERRGVMVALEDSEGHVAWGESSPLPGFSIETQKASRAALERIVAPSSPLFHRSWSDVQAVETGLMAFDVPPSARHALDQALLGLLATTRAISVPRLISDNPLRAVRVHRLVADEAEANVALSEGVRCVKVKVGRDAPAADIRRVRRIRKIMGDEAIIRLDANGAWSLPVAVETLAALEEVSLGCVEAPVADSDLQSMAALRRRLSIPIAADESMRTMADLRRIIALGAADVVVIKPMLVGGLTAGLSLARHALSAGLEVYVTTTIDASVARWGALFLASALGKSRVHGLDTGAFLRQDVGSGPLACGGVMRVELDSVELPNHPREAA